MHNEPESLLWSDTPSRPIEDEIARAVAGNHPLQTESTRARAVAAELGQTYSGAYNGELIRTATQIFRGYLEL
jgi:hypothetical protein